jgi:ech hydrogenase subunit D
MSGQSDIETITPDVLLQKVRALRDRKFRLVQISAARLPESMELTYSFDLQNQLANLRLLLPLADPRVPSINSIFPCVLLYENEIHDLFDIKVEGMAIDFHGNLYKTAIKFPFATVKAPGTNPVTTAKPAASAKTAT